MDAKPIGNKKGKKKSSSSNLGFDIIFWSLNCIAVPLSGYQTYGGYVETIGEVGAIAIAVLSALLFFALNMLIRDRRLKGKNTLIMLFGYIVPLSLSFFGFFNNFYADLVNDKYFFDELEHYQEVTSDNETFALKALEEEMQPCQDDIANINDRMYNVMEEFSGVNGGAVGCGYLCNRDLDSLLAQIAQIPYNLQFDTYTERKIMKLRSMGASMRRSQIDEMKNLLRSKVGEITSEYEERERVRLDYDNRKQKIDSFVYLADFSSIDSIKVESKIDAEHAVWLLANLKKMNNNILNEIVGLGDRSQDDIESRKIVEVDAISFKNPGWTVNQVVSMKFPGYVISSLLFALVIDLASLLFIYLAYQKKKPSFLEF